MPYEVGAAVAGNLIGGAAGLIGAGAQRKWAADQNMKAMNFNSDEALKARNFNAQEAEKSRNFEEMMSSSAVQRKALDYKAAGYNPILGGMEGGASTPSGGMASGPSASGASSGFSYERAKTEDYISRAVSSALEAKNVKEMVRKNTSEISLNAANERSKDAEAHLLYHSARKVKTEADNAEYVSRSIKADADAAEENAKIRSNHPILNYSLDKIGSVGSAVGSIMAGAAAGKYIIKGAQPKLGSDELIVNTRTGDQRRR